MGIHSTDTTRAIPGSHSALLGGCSVTDPAGVEGAAMLLKRASMTAKEAPTTSPWGFRQKRLEPWLLRNLLFVVDVTGISTTN